jgi:hypothetical protein
MGARFCYGARRTAKPRGDVQKFARDMAVVFLPVKGKTENELDASPCNLPDKSKLPATFKLNRYTNSTIDWFERNRPETPDNTPWCCENHAP